MASTPTSRLRLMKQATYDNPDSWGVELNQGAIDMADEALGAAAVTVNSNVTLSAQNFLSDQARRLLLALSGAGGFNVTVPAPDKPYIIMNGCAADVTIVPQGGSGAVVRAGTWAVFYSDGTNGHVLDNTLDKVKAPSADVDLNSKKITDLGAPTDATDAANKGYVDGKKLSGFQPADADVDFGSQKGVNVAAPANDADAANKKYVDDKAASLVVDVNNAVLAAQGYASAASGSASAASGFAGDASGYASAASGFAGDASGYAAAALNTYKDFDRRYLGPKATAPTVDNEGNALIVGALYFNSAVGSMFVYGGSNWIIIDAVTFANQTQAEAGVDNSTVMTPLRVAQAILAQPRPYTQIASVAASGPAVTFSSLPQTFGELLVMFTDVTQDSGTNQSLRIEVSADGSTFSSPANATSSGAGYRGNIQFIGYTNELSLIVMGVGTNNNLGTSPAVNAAGIIGAVAARHTGGMKAVRFSFASGNFNAGTITLYGR